MPPQLQQQRMQQLGPPPRMPQGPQGLVTQPPPPQQMIQQQAPFQFPPPGVPPGIHPQMAPHYSYPPPFGRAGATGPIPPGMIQPPANLAPQWEKPTTVEQNYFDPSRQQTQQQQQQQQQRGNRSRSPTPGVQSPRNRSSKSPQPRQDQAHSGDFSNKYNKEIDSRSGYKHSRFVNI
jgi:hypothetical protein